MISRNPKVVIGGMDYGWMINNKFCRDFEYMFNDIFNIFLGAVEEPSGLISVIDIHFRD